MSPNSSPDAYNDVEFIKSQAQEYFDIDQPIKAEASLTEYKDISRINKVADMILKMGWTYFLEEPCNKLIYQLIDKKIIKCEDVFDVPVLDRI